jgi:hypothetical protein
VAELTQAFASFWRRSWLVQLCVLSCACACAACHGCNDKTPVPFKRNSAVLQPADAPQPSLPSAPTAPTAPSLPSFADGTQQITLDGASLQRTAGSFRAALGLDLDGDGQRDALLLATDAQGRPVIEIVRREQAQWSTQLTTLALLSDAATCSITSASLEALGTEAVLASLEASCDRAPSTAPSSAPAPPAQAAQAAPAAPPEPKPGTNAAATAHGVSSYRFVVSTEAAPRLLLSLTTRAPAEAGASAALKLALSTEDHDGDDHADLRADVEVALPQASTPLQIHLSWLNRPSGLARDLAEPEQTLSSLATEAQKLLPQKPALALPIAEQALTLHRALCREAGAALLQVDGQAGLPCGASAAAGKAAAVRTIALAKTNQLFAALDAVAALDSTAYRIEASLRKRAARALGDFPGDTRYVWQLGPALRAPEAPNVRLPAVAFVDQDHLLLRGVLAQSYELASHSVTPSGAPTSLLVVDARNRFAITEITSKCDGDHLVITPAEQIVAGVVAGRSTQEPLIAAASDETGGTCTTAAAKPLSRRSRVLGLSAQGAVVASGSVLYLVPLTDAGAADGEPRVLADSEPAPQLLAAGALSADGHRYALAVSEGVALVVRGGSPAATLIRPPASCGGPISDIALSPLGDRVAMICAGHVYIAQQPSAAGEPTAPALDAGASTQTAVTSPQSAATAGFPPAADTAKPAIPLQLQAPPEPEHPAEPAQAAPLRPAPPNPGALPTRP